MFNTVERSIFIAYIERIECSAIRKAIERGNEVSVFLCYLKYSTKLNEVDKFLKQCWKRKIAIS